MGKVRDVTLIGLLAALIAFSGSLKIPGLFSGTEFQLSAPIAVAIAANFGFTRYIMAGIIASLISLLLGTHNVINVMVSMVFRLIAGGTIALLRPRFLVVLIAGPLGSFIARLCLWPLLGKALVPVLVASFPGMAYTVLTVWPLTKLLGRIKNLSIWRDVDYGRSGEII